MCLALHRGGSGVRLGLLKGDRAAQVESCKAVASESVTLSRDLFLVVQNTILTNSQPTIVPNSSKSCSVKSNQVPETARNKFHISDMQSHMTPPELLA